MKLYAAIDLHANNNVLVVTDEQDRIVCERRLRNELPPVLAELAPHRGRIQAIAVESTFNWYWLVDGLMEAGYTVKLVNAAAVKKYDGLKYTDDEGDAARVLAVESNLAVLRCLDEQIKKLERALLKQARLKPAFRRLLTVTGVWKILAMTIMYEAGDMSRFAKVGKFASKPIRLLLHPPL